MCCLAVTIIWAATGGPFWPMWVWTGLGLPIALQVAWRRAWAQPRGPRRRLAIQGSISVVLGGYLVLVWAMGGFGFFWPVFPAVGLAMAFVVHALFYSPRQVDLSARVDELTRTRRGALDVQSAELRRIERDLHDGAQARLVALTMQLGRAEARLEDRPETGGAGPPGRARRPRPRSPSFATSRGASPLRCWPTAAWSRPSRAWPSALGSTPPWRAS